MSNLAQIIPLPGARGRRYSRPSGLATLLATVHLLAGATISTTPVAGGSLVSATLLLWGWRHAPLTALLAADGLVVWSALELARLPAGGWPYAVYFALGEVMVTMAAWLLGGPAARGYQPRRRPPRPRGGRHCSSRRASVTPPCRLVRTPGAIPGRPSRSRGADLTAGA